MCGQRGGREYFGGGGLLCMPEGLYGAREVACVWHTFGACGGDIGRSMKML